MKTAIHRVLCLVMAASGVGCGGGTGDGAAGCTPGTSATITITSMGVMPSAVCILPGGTVTFTNGDVVAHDIQSDMTCPQLNLGEIAPTGSKTTAAFPVAATCPFHDEANSSPAFQGTVTVTSAPEPVPGY